MTMTGQSFVAIVLLIIWTESLKLELPAWEQIWALLLCKWIFYGLFTRWIYKIDSGDLGNFPSVVPGYGHIFFHIATHKGAIHNSSLPDNVAVHPMRNTIARHRQVGSRLWWVCEHWTLTEQQAETQITSAVTVQWPMSSASRCRAQDVHLGLFLCLDCLVSSITIEATISADRKQPFWTLTSSILPFSTAFTPYLFLAFHCQLFICAQFHFWFFEL